MSKLDIPESWAEATLEQISSQLGRGKSPTYSEKDTGYYAINQKCIYWEVIKLENRKPVTKAWFDSIKQEQIAKVGDILINSTGTGTLGRACVWEDNTKASIPDTHVTVLRAKPEVVPKYVMCFLKSKAGQELIESATTGSTNQIELNKTKLSKGSLPLPPIDEQKRIVAKIKSTQSKIGEIQNCSRRAEELIGKYREALLQKAFRGELVPQSPNDESAFELLKRIRIERAKQSDGKKRKQDDLPEIKPEEIPFEIPKSWEWIRLGDLANRIIDGNYGEKYPTQKELLPAGVPFLTAAAIGQGNRLILDKVKYISQAKHKMLLKAQSKNGDILITNRGARVGDAILINEPGFEDFNIGPQVTRIEVDDRIADKNFVFSCILSNDFRRSFIGSNEGSAMNFISLTKTVSQLVPLPPLAEQREIVKRLKTLSEEVSSLERMTLGVNSLTAKISGSILAAAFFGRLVNQEPYEGTGHELLEKIKQSAQSQLVSKTSRATTKSKTGMITRNKK
ncbi:MAG: hypothetical protein A2622_04360 [Bdellovibrionales bacterium RIFCSPHIGHO2_01_FULL_40_29]|nr:MAG: hypothetical protein A2622_04360 [Bdellovibrionales bacterium RIFCSPHIGHO2_01_FULL_40_29]OFZ34829.1 MAG: hypothetical protein A3D17_11015 [Bdellovibrionales bacterium RIFCSPHIGHO2_02_FULL_40_15]